MTVIKRVVANAANLQLRPYDRYGAAIPGMSWHPVSEDKVTGEASFFLRFEPGARSRPHEHVLREEFLILEGELLDHDGRLFKVGDFVSYDAGSKHWSQSPKGCLILAVLRCHNRMLASDESISEFS